MVISNLIVNGLPSMHSLLRTKEAGTRALCHALRHGYSYLPQAMHLSSCFRVGLAAQKACCVYIQGMGRIEWLAVAMTIHIRAMTLRPAGEPSSRKCVGRAPRWPASTSCQLVGSWPNFQANTHKGLLTGPKRLLTASA